MLVSYEGMLVALCHIVNNNSTTFGASTAAATTVDTSTSNTPSPQMSSNKSKVATGTPTVSGTDNNSISGSSCGSNGINTTVMEQAYAVLSFITPIYTTRILTALSTNSSNGGSSGDIQKPNDKMYTCLLSWARSISMLRLIFPVTSSSYHSSYQTLFQPLFTALLQPLKGYCLHCPSPTPTPIAGRRDMRIEVERENILSSYMSNSPFGRLSHWVDTDNKTAVWISLLTHLLQTCSSSSTTATANSTTATTSGTGNQHFLGDAEAYWTEFASLAPTIQHQGIIQWMTTLHGQNSGGDNNTSMTSNPEQFEQYMIQYITLFETVNNRLPCPIFRPREGHMTSSLLEYMHATSSTIGRFVYSYSCISSVIIY